MLCKSYLSRLLNYRCDGGGKENKIDNLKHISEGKKKAQAFICSMGMHSYKEAIFTSKDTPMVLEVKVCKHCRRPSGKTLKILLGSKVFITKEKLSCMENLVIEVKEKSLNFQMQRKAEKIWHEYIRKDM